MKLSFVITIFLVVLGVVNNHVHAKQYFDRSAFYAAMASENIDLIDAQLKAVLNSSVINKDAFEGSLLIRKAGLVTNFGSKFSLFKSGHKKLDQAIANESDNAELRFLRLMIQENVPRILNYRRDIDEDSKIIRSAYKSLPPVVQKVVADYSKKSRALKPVFS